MPNWRRWRRPMSWRRGRWRRPERYLGLAERGLEGAVPARPARAGAADARDRPAPAGPPARATCRRWPRRRSGCRPWPRRRTAAQPGLGEELRALALISLGDHRVWTGRFDLGRAAPGAGRRAGAPDRAALSRVHRPGLPGGGRALPVVSAGGRAQQAGDRAGRAARLDRRADRGPRLHGARIRAGLAGTGRRGRALGAARRAYRQTGSRARVGDGGPATSAACSSWRAAGSPTRWPRSGPPSGWPGGSPAPHPLVLADTGLARARPGAPWRYRGAEQVLAGLSERDRDRGEMRIATAVLRLAQDDPHAAIAVLAPVLDGSAPRGLAGPGWLRRSCWRRLPGTRSATRPPPTGPWSARSTWPNPTARSRGSCCIPRRACSSAHARQGTAHAALIAEILGLLAAKTPAPPPAGPPPLLDPLSESELRVLRYLPTNLSAPEIAGSCTSRRTRSRPTCATCTPSSACTAGPTPSSRARALGLLAPSAQRG